MPFLFFGFESVFTCEHDTEVFCAVFEYNGATGDFAIEVDVDFFDDAYMMEVTRFDFLDL